MIGASQLLLTCVLWAVCSILRPTTALLSIGQECELNAECSSNYCLWTNPSRTGFCCLNYNSVCGSSEDCCGGLCIGGTCSKSATRMPCDYDGMCESGLCLDYTCRETCDHTTDCSEETYIGRYCMYYNSADDGYCCSKPGAPCILNANKCCAGSQCIDETCSYITFSLTNIYQAPEFYPCDGNDWQQCASGSTCDLDLHQCVKEYGQPCSQNYQCTDYCMWEAYESGHCCLRPYHSCSNQTQCCAGSTCLSNNTCSCLTPQSTCDSSSFCCNGKECVDHKCCAPPGSTTNCNNHNDCCVGSRCGLINGSYRCYIPTGTTGCTSNNQCLSTATCVAQGGGATKCCGNNGTLCHDNSWCCATGSGTCSGSCVY